MKHKKVGDGRASRAKRNTVANKHLPILGKLTPLVLQTICDLHGDGIPLTAACDHQNVSLSGFYTHLSKHPEFKAEVFQPARERFIDLLEDKAFNMAMSTDSRFPTMLIFMLKAHRRSVYGDRVNATLTPGGEFATAFYTAMEKTLNAVSSTQH